MRSLVVAVLGIGLLADRRRLLRCRRREGEGREPPCRARRQDDRQRQGGPGIEETAKGVGATVVEGAKYSGDKLKASGRAAQPAATSAWTNFKESASSFGVGVKRFFTRLFS